jgi:hypothetical protein
MQFKKNLKLNQMPLNESQKNIQNDILKVINKQKLSDVYIAIDNIRENLKNNSIIDVSH